MASERLQPTIELYESEVVYFMGEWQSDRQLTIDGMARFVQSSRIDRAQEANRPAPDFDDMPPVAVINNLEHQEHHLSLAA